MKFNSRNIHQAIAFFLTLILGIGCGNEIQKANLPRQFLWVGGIAQDAGYPHIACLKECCKRVAEGKQTRKNVTSIAYVNLNSQTYWLFEASPDLPQQLLSIQAFFGLPLFQLPEGVFLSHAHIGHYAGLMYFGREAMAADKVPVYTLPK